MNQRTITTVPAKLVFVSGMDAVDPAKVDVGIWELMSDFRKRTISQITDAMSLMGFNRKTVDTRMKSLFAKKWFDRSGERTSNVVYILKKHVKHPEAKETLVMETKKLENSALPHDPVADAGKRMADHLDPHPQAQQLLSHNEQLDPAPAATAEVEVLMDSRVGVLAEMPEPIKYVVEKTDVPKVAIWKIMQDGEAYTATELGLLLDHFPKFKIYNALMAMKPVLIQTKVKGQRESEYKLAPGAPMPVPKGYTRDIEEAAPPAAEQPQPKQKEITMQSQPTLIIHPSMQSNTADITNPVHANSAKAPAAAPLFEVSFKIMGKEMSMAQVRELRNYLDGINIEHLASYLASHDKTEDLPFGLILVINEMPVRFEDALKLRQELAQL